MIPNQIFTHIPQLRIPESELRPGAGLLLDPRQCLHPPRLPTPPQVHRGAEISGAGAGPADLVLPVGHLHDGPPGGALLSSIQGGRQQE